MYIYGICGIINMVGGHLGHASSTWQSPFQSAFFETQNGAPLVWQRLSDLGDGDLKPSIQACATIRQS